MFVHNNNSIIATLTIGAGFCSRFFPDKREFFPLPLFCPIDDIKYTPKVLKSNNLSANIKIMLAKVSSMYAPGHSIEKFSLKSANVCVIAAKHTQLRVFRCPSVTQARGGTLAVVLRRGFKRRLNDDDLYRFCTFGAHCWAIYFVWRFKHTSSVIRTALHLQWHFCFVCKSFRWKA